MKARRRKRHRNVSEDQAPYTVSSHQYSFLEFFAGGGMARAALAPTWKSVWANDFSASKASIYQRNWGIAELRVGDVADIDPASLPEAQMAWGSFPCQDLSQAGGRVGIGKHDDRILTRSGSFWPFWNIIAKRRPPIVVLENVEGALKANRGADIVALCAALQRAGYRFGALVVDAVDWVPQSRARLFIVAVTDSVQVSRKLCCSEPDPMWHPKSVCGVFESLETGARESWVWWHLPQPPPKRLKVEALIDVEGDAWVKWDPPEKTRYILSLMNGRHIQKVEHAREMKRRIVGFAYRRTRAGRQRAEVRFDGIAGCLRTASGGSSKQIVVEVNGSTIRTRLLSPREAARLQGLSDTYWLPPDYNEAYDLVGDGLCVPVVSYLGQHLLTPLASHIETQSRATA